MQPEVEVVEHIADRAGRVGWQAKLCPCGPKHAGLVRTSLALAVEQHAA